MVKKGAGSGEKEAGNGEKLYFLQDEHVQYYTQKNDVSWAGENKSSTIHLL